MNEFNQTALADLQKQVRTLTDQVAWLEKNFKIPPERHATLPYGFEIGAGGASSISDATTTSNANNTAALVKNQATEQKPKLINWAMAGMGGCMTSNGRLTRIYNAIFNSIHEGWDCRGDLKILRLVTPKEHEGWQSALNFKDVDAVIKKLRTQCVVEVKTAPSISFGGNVQSIIAFRVTGLQAGYTDDLTKTF